jgi:hypothetical protein
VALEEQLGRCHQPQAWPVRWTCVVLAYCWVGCLAEVAAGMVVGLLEAGAFLAAVPAGLPPCL